MIGYMFVLLLGLLGDAQTKGKVGQEQKGKFSVPVLDVNRQLVLKANQTLTINCRGRWELSWSLPGSVARDQDVKLENSRCGKHGQRYCSQVTLHSAQAEHTGSYRCQYAHQTRKQRAVYIYVTDSQQPFVARPSPIPDMVYMILGEPLVFPCRVTDPNAIVSLVKYPDSHELTLDQVNIVWNSKRGFVIQQASLFYTGMFSCQTTVNGTTYAISYLTHRQVNSIMDVYLNTTSPLQTLQGNSLTINCTINAEFNGRVSITWDYPDKSAKAVITKRMIENKYINHNVFYSLLTITRLRPSDGGLYICRVASGPVLREANVSVTVYDRPFIRLKPKQSSVLVAHAGQKSYRLSPKLRAFPDPMVIWLKDGKVAAEQCSRYHVDGNSLVIRDVAEEDAGKYSILVKIQEHRLYRNLTLSLVVNVRPGISEKAMSVQAPGSVPRGSRQTLHCTSHGVPPPQIAWLWHPCPLKGRCVFFLRPRYYGAP